MRVVKEGKFISNNMSKINPRKNGNQTDAPKIPWR
jgi:hypothetical protein